MAFIITRDRVIQALSGRIVSGTYTADATTGTIVTGLGVCTSISLQPISSAVVTSFPVVDSAETFPVTDGNVSVIVAASGNVGTFTACGW